MITEVPGIEGDPGADGTNGIDGTNAYTITTAGFTTPAVSATVAVTVADNSWMILGQILYIQNAGFYEVISKSGTTSVTVENTGYTPNVGSGVLVAAGAGISPGGSEPSLTGYATAGANVNITSLGGLTTPLSVSQGGSGRAAAVAPQAVYATGTAYTLTASFADLNFGTTDPTITFAVTGKYLLTAQVMVYLQGATFVASRQFQFKLKINATTDVPSSLTVMETGIQTTATAGRSVPLQPVIYDATAGEVLTLQGLVSVLPSAGSVTCEQASIVATLMPGY